MNDILLNALRARITRVFPAQIRAAVEPLTDEQLWWRPNKQSNAIGNLLLHLTGSINYYLSRNLGLIAFERDRAAEFAERAPRPKAELLALFEDMVERTERTFDSLTPGSLAAPSPEQSMHTLAVEDLVNVTAHFAFHAGQIVWIAKMFDGGIAHETWIKTHRQEGAWKGKLVQ